jgi:hypothetical protein
MDGDRRVTAAYRIERMRPRVWEPMIGSTDSISNARETAKRLQNSDPGYRYRIVRVTTTQESDVVWQSDDSKNGEG